MRVATVTNRTRDTIVGESVEIADTFLARLWGLLGRSGLTSGGGLWIKPSSGVHTIGMRFSIDVIGLDKNMQVVKVWSDVAPFRLTSIDLRIASVVELAAGHARSCKIEIGDTIQIS